MSETAIHVLQTISGYIVAVSFVSMAYYDRKYKLFSMKKETNEMNEKQNEKRIRNDIDIDIEKGILGAAITSGVDNV